MIGEDRRKPGLILRLQERIQCARRQFCERFVSGREDGERAFPLEGIHEAGRLDGPIHPIGAPAARFRLIPCAALLEGEYGVQGLFVGVPVVVGAGGIERIVEITFTPDEQAAFTKSADAVRELLALI